MKYFKLLTCLLVLLFGCIKSDNRLYVENITLILKKTMVIELLSENGEGRIATAPAIYGCDSKDKKRLTIV